MFGYAMPEGRGRGRGERGKRGRKVEGISRYSFSSNSRSLYPLG